MGWSLASWVLAAALLALVVAVGLLIWWVLRGDKPTTYASNPNPSRITDEMWWLWQQLLALEPSSKLGGIYANKPGYHNCRGNLPQSDYSVCDDPPDQGGPPDKAAAIDWTFPDAQAGNYSTIAKYTNRLLASAKDPDDTRLNGWREFYGNADDDSYVEGWDCRYGVAATSDSSHLWHIHISENRDQTKSQKNKEALLSVLKGETFAQWMGATGGEGAVLLNCPYDKARQDLFYVGPSGEVWHRWFTGGLNTMWSSGGSSENLGGRVAPGTLTATWKADQGSIDIAALGDPDDNAPKDAGQYWGMNLTRQGKRSGWGSFTNCYGAYPGLASAPPSKTVPERDVRLVALVALVAALIALAALIVAVAD